MVVENELSKCSFADLGVELWTVLTQHRTKVIRDVTAAFVALINANIRPLMSSSHITCSFVNTASVSRIHQNLLRLLFSL